MDDGTQARRVVLVGGGHAHALALQVLGRAGRGAVRVTLVSPEPTTPYSGLLPAYVAGLASRADMEIDLARLAARWGVRFLKGRAARIDREGRRVILADGGTVPYDILSLDVGIAPDLSRLPGAEAHGIPVKPIAAFAARWDAIRSRLETLPGRPAIAVAGGGVAGAELAMAFRTAFAGRDPAVTLVCEGEVAPGLNDRARRLLAAALARRGVTVETVPAAALESACVRLADGRSLACDAAFVTTGAAAPALVAASGLPCDEAGFARVRETLQLADDDDIFAAGDCAAMIGHPRPKAGVFAVRQGPPLADNILRRVAGWPCRPVVPQRDHLVLIGTGDGRAVAARGGRLAASGRAAWWLKTWLDRRWMARLRD